MSSKGTKWLICAGLIIPVLVIALWLFSPYRHHDGFAYKLIKNTVEINAPADSVFRFLGHSANATRWSVFVDHISTLNPHDVADGKVGSQRRCFCKADEQGRQWDEVVTRVVPNNRRQIRCYHMVGFPVSAEGLGTEQLYKPLSQNKCRLTFTLFFITKEPSRLDDLKIRLAGYYVKRIFVQNMDHIKRIIETGK